MLTPVKAFFFLLTDFLMQFLTVTGQSTLAADFKEVHTKLLPNGLPIHEFILDNGFRVVFAPNSQNPLIAYQFWIPTLSSTAVQDPEFKSPGLAHIVEHILFRGFSKFFRTDVRWRPPWSIDASDR